MRKSYNGSSLIRFQFLNHLISLLTFSSLVLQSFLKGETPILADEAFHNAVQSYTELFLRSDRVLRAVTAGGLSSQDFRDVFRLSVERRVRSLPDIDGLSKETVLTSWMVKFDAIFKGLSIIWIYVVVDFFFLIAASQRDILNCLRHSQLTVWDGGTKIKVLSLLGRRVVCQLPRIVLAETVFPLPPTTRIRLTILLSLEREREQIEKLAYESCLIWFQSLQFDGS